VTLARTFASSEYNRRSMPRPVALPVAASIRKRREQGKHGQSPKTARISASIQHQRSLAGLIVPNKAGGLGLPRLLLTQGVESGRDNGDAAALSV
jgi:hypothetical protein